MSARLAIIAAILMLSPACTALVPVVCEEPEFDPPGRLTCATAAAAARDALADTAGITRLEVIWAACPANARCVGPNGDFATVVATRLDPSDAVAVLVSVGADGVVRAEAPQSIMPSEAPAGG
jgi:predicted amino acid dehydrogenase